MIWYMYSYIYLCSLSIFRMSLKRIKVSPFNGWLKTVNVFSVPVIILWVSTFCLNATWRLSLRRITLFFLVVLIPVIYKKETALVKKSFNLQCFRLSTNLNVTDLLFFTFIYTRLLKHQIEGDFTTPWENKSLLVRLTCCLLTLL